MGVAASTWTHVGLSVSSVGVGLSMLKVVEASEDTGTEP